MPANGVLNEGVDGSYPGVTGLTDAALNEKLRRMLGGAVPGAIKDPDGDWRPFMPVGRRVLLPGRGTTFVREIEGPPGAPTVVLLHGFMASAGLNWFRAFEELGKEFHVLAPDLRGHARGLRSRRHVRLADCADDLAVMLDQLGTGPVIAAGYSMGGPVAQLLWRRHPERVNGLVFCATSARLQDTYGTEPLTDVYLAALSAVARTTDQLAAIPSAGARLLRRGSCPSARELPRVGGRGIPAARRADAGGVGPHLGALRLERLDRRSRRADVGRDDHARPPGAARRAGAARHTRSTAPRSSSSTPATSCAPARPSASRCWLRCAASRPAPSA